MQTQDAAESIYTTFAGTMPLLPIPYSESDPSHQFSQEARLSLVGNGPLHWTVGAFYSDMTSDWNEYASGINPSWPKILYFQSYVRCDVADIPTHPFSAILAAATSMPA